MRTTSLEGAVEGARPRRGVLPVTCLALATVVSAVASLNVAIPSIAHDTHASQTELSWVVDAYSLVFAALLLPAGAFGDRLGRRAALIGGLFVFGAGSAAALLSADAHWLIAMRAVLGVGAALVMPATLSTITSTFPGPQRESAVGTWAGVAGGSAILGLLASGVVLEQWSWRAVFVLNVILAVAALIGTVLVVPESADPDAPRVDRRGAVIAAVGLSVLVYSIIEAPTAGWTATRTLAGLACGALVMVAFVLVELRVRRPLLDPRLFGRGGFASGSLTITLQFFAFFGFIFIVLQYLQLVRGASPLEAALGLIPMALGMMPASRGLAPRLAARIGPARASAIGLVVAAAAFGWMSLLDESSSYWPMLVGLVPLGIGMGMAMTPATSTITRSLPREQQGVGSAMNDLARELGGALGIAVLGSVLQSVYRHSLDLSQVAAASAGQARESLALAIRIDPAVAQNARAAFADGMQTALLVAAGIVLVAAVAGLVLGRASQEDGLAADSGRSGGPQRRAEAGAVR